jgi:hypothetical protein
MLRSAVVYRLFFRYSRGEEAGLAKRCVKDVVPLVVCVVERSTVPVLSSALFSPGPSP